jgi:hypothetical protein
METQHVCDKKYSLLPKIAIFLSTNQQKPAIFYLF